MKLKMKDLKTEHPIDLVQFVPDIYQKDVYSINYTKLKYLYKVNTLTFDLDDTLAGLTWWIPSKKSIRLFYYLKRIGFRVIILSNASERRVNFFKKKLNADDAFFKVHKPESHQAWLDVMSKYDISPNEIVHIGNSMIDDVYGGHKAGIKVALVRRNGFIVKVYKFFQFFGSLGKGTSGHQIRKELKKEHMFYKHHIKKHGDQYYDNWSELVRKIDDYNLLD